MKSPEGHIATGDIIYRRLQQFYHTNDNSYLDNPSSVVASPINETNKMSSVRSFRLLLQMFTSNNTVSPVLDVGTVGAIAIANRLNKYR